MRVAQSEALLRGGLPRNPAWAAVEADAGRRLRDRLVEDVVHDRHVHVGNSGVVEERAAPPVPTDKTDAEVAEPVVDAAVKAYVRTPVTGVPYVQAVRPAPVPRRPQCTDEGRKHPIAGHPVIAVESIGPIPRYPEVTWSGAYRLGINRNRRRSDRNRHEHSALRSRCHAQGEHGHEE